jgi:nitrate/nitrite-specific signal transduction histidine kinase
MVRHWSIVLWRVMHPSENNQPQLNSYWALLSYLNQLRTHYYLCVTDDYFTNVIDSFFSITKGEAPSAAKINIVVLVGCLLGLTIAIIGILVIYFTKCRALKPRRFRADSTALSWTQSWGGGWGWDCTHGYLYVHESWISHLLTSKRVHSHP